MYILKVIRCPISLFGALKIDDILKCGIYPVYSSLIIDTNLLQSAFIFSYIFFSNSKNLLINGVIRVPSLAGLLYAVSYIVIIFFSLIIFAVILFVLHDHNQ